MVRLLYLPIGIPIKGWRILSDNAVHLGFADFVEAPQPSPAPIVSDSSTPAAAPSSVPYTKWYRVWERTSPRDFMQEALIMPFVIVIAIFHLWGTRKNRRKAREWAQAHVPALRSEFAVVGFGGCSAVIG